MYPLFQEETARNLSLTSMGPSLLSTSHSMWLQYSECEPNHHATYLHIPTASILIHLATRSVNTHGFIPTAPTSKKWCGSVLQVVWMSTRSVLQVVSMTAHIDQSLCLLFEKKS